MINCPRPNITIGEIPTTYLESLSYLEQIMCINKKLCDIIKYLDQYSFDNIEKLIDEQIAILKNYVDQQIIDTKNYCDIQLNAQVALLKELINQKILFLLDFIKNNNSAIYDYINKELQDLKNEIDNIIINGIDVYDPTTGQYNNIQDVVYNMYKYLRYFGITASEFDGLSLTASEFDSKNLTARQFDLYSRELLLVNFYHNMFSPFTGQITSITNVINQLANLHKQAITAISFDNLNLTASNFDNKDLTAYQFDWNGNTLLIN